MNNLKIVKKFLIIGFALIITGWGSLALAADLQGVLNEQNLKSFLPSDMGQVLNQAENFISSAWRDLNINKYLEDLKNFSRDQIENQIGSSAEKLNFKDLIKKIFDIIIWIIKQAWEIIKSFIPKV